MNKKERIIELVKQNIITLEEALDLLEASDVEFVQQQAPTSRQQTEEVEHPFTSDTTNADEHNEPGVAMEDLRKDELNQRRTELETQLKSLEESKTILQQRLREFDILSELDPLTEELIEQREALIEQQEVLLEQIEDIYDEIDDIHDELDEINEETHDAFDWREDLKRVIDIDSDRISQEAAYYANEARRGGEKLSKSIKDWATDFAENFKMKEWNINVQVPWVKDNPFDVSDHYPAEGIQMIDINNLNGDVTVRAGENEQIELELVGSIYGKDESIDVQYFYDNGWVILTEDKLAIALTSPKIQVDIVLTLPKKRFDMVDIRTVNGDIDVTSVESEELKVNSTNGDIQLAKTQSSEATIDLVNGDTHIKDSQIDTIVHKTVNGDFSIDGQLTNASITAVHADCYITKRDTNPARIKVETQSGDIMLATPQAMKVDIQSKAQFGNIKYRMTDTEEENISEVDGEMRSSRLRRNQLSADDGLEATLKTRLGDIYIKDNEFNQ